MFRMIGRIIARIMVSVTVRIAERVCIRIRGMLEVLNVCDLVSVINNM